MAVDRAAIPLDRINAAGEPSSAVIRSCTAIWVGLFPYRV
jgi:hypothetical protein